MIDQVKTDSMLSAGANWLCDHCAAIQPGEKVLVLCNPSTLDVAREVFTAAQRTSSQVALHMIPNLSIHGREPSAETAAVMLAADVIFCLTVNSLAHSNARFAATQNGSKFLSLPDYSPSVMSSPALLTDFADLVADAETITGLLTKGRQVRLKSQLGTDLTFDISGRQGNCAPGLVRNPGTLGSPPDSEANIAPLETSCEGTYVVDGSIPCAEIGLLECPVTLTFAGGRVVSIESENAHYVETLNTLFDTAGQNARVLGEFGIGLNPAAKLCGIMLIDEGARGTIHLGIGSNATIGGQNKVPFHLDFVMNAASVDIDGVPLMELGQIISVGADR